MGKNARMDDNNMLDFDTIMNKLDPLEIQKTCKNLYYRIEERFPKSCLLNICNDLLVILLTIDKRVKQIQKPQIFYRFLASLFIVCSIVAFIGLFVSNKLRTDMSIAYFFQMIDSGLNTVLLIAVGFISIVTLERRKKRFKIIKAINKLRSLAHIIDSAQLTKDPHRLNKVNSTEHSPTHEFITSSFLLNRYLDYCSEMLSLISKIGFLYVQNFEDPDANDAMNDLESLCNGLERKIWQKIIITNSEKHGTN